MLRERGPEKVNRRFSLEVFGPFTKRPQLIHHFCLGKTTYLLISENETRLHDLRFVAGADRSWASHYEIRRSSDAQFREGFYISC
jgi:hypothetical protein